MKVMVVGSGGREHALAFCISRSPRLTKLVCAPGNAGTAPLGESISLNAEDPEAVVGQAQSLGIDLVVVGPEAPLVAGVVDACEKAGIAAFGPRAEGAQLEGSKVFAKRFMAEAGVPTAAFEVFDDPDKADAYVEGHSGKLVVKADGLAAGKGVIVTSDAAGAKEAIDLVMRRKAFGAAGDRVVIEERLVGEEVSYHIVCDGSRYVPMAASQDHKAIFEGDKGPNTGGMGAYSPPPIVTAEVEQAIIDQVVEPTMKGLKKRGIDFRGVLYFGLMMVEGVPNVLEFNVRFGDPETQALVIRWKGDFIDLLMGSARGDLSQVKPQWEAPASICVVLAAEGYPGPYPKGREITGLEEAGKLPGVEVFHAGTAMKEGKVVTSGGRVLSVTAIGDSIDAVAEKAYQAAKVIRFEGMQYRRDIGYRARSGWK
jgi:phosphoribosylamine--glycine ligase